MLVTQSYDGVVVEELALDDASAIDQKLEAAVRTFVSWSH